MPNPPSGCASRCDNTPLALQRSLVEVALADPDVSVDSLRHAGEQVVTATQEQERIVDALLVLARSQRGVERREEIDVAGVVRRLLTEREPDLARRRLQLTVTTEPATTRGDPQLVERLVVNLVDNAIVHNVPDG